MDWHKLKNHKALKYSLLAVAGTAVSAVFVLVSVPIVRELNDSFAFKEFKKIGVVATYRKHYHYFFDELEDLARADAREDSLVRELASVQKELEVERAKNFEIETGEETQKIAEQLKVETGSKIARIPDGIKYVVPTSILPHQLQVLGIGYFRKQEYEKSAVIFHELTHLKEDNSFQKPANYLISAISWYKLKHFEMASDYLKLTQKTSEQGSVLFRQSLLWQAVVENARGNKNESQKVLTRLISLYPQSEEVTWVNRKRTPAAAPVHEQVVHEQAVHEQTKEESHHE